MAAPQDPTSTTSGKAGNSQSSNSQSSNSQSSNSQSSNSLSSYRGLVLAAGYGSRMRPLTDVTPKPLLPFFTSTIVEFALMRLEPVSSGVTVNCFHLKERMIDYFDRFHGDKGFNLFLEEQLLGTGGTIASLKDWLGDDDLIIYNSDIYSTVTMQDVISHHEREQAAATMVLLPEPIAGKTIIYRNHSGIMAIGGEPPRPGHSTDHAGGHNGDQITNHLFTGIHILSNRFVKEMPDTKPYQVVDQYQSFLKRGEKIAGYIYDGPWFDIGEPHHYFEAIEQLTTTYKEPFTEVLAQIKASGRERHAYSLRRTEGAAGQRQGDKQRVYCFGEEPAGLEGATAHDCVFMGGNTPVAPGGSYSNALYLDDKVLPFSLKKSP